MNELMVLLLLYSIGSPNPVMPAAERKAFVAQPAQKLIEWTPANLKKQKGFFAEFGSYTMCGKFLFTVTPPFGGRPPVPMLGFGYVDPRGAEIVVLTDSRKGSVRIKEITGGVPFVESGSDRRYILGFPTREYAEVKKCLGVKGHTVPKKL